MRRFLPDSLAVWALLIVIAGLTVTQISTFAAIFQSRAATGRMMGFFHLAERVSSVTRAIVDQAPEQRPALAKALSAPTLQVQVGTAPQTGNVFAADDELAELEDILENRLVAAGIADVHVERREPVEPGLGAVAAPAEGASSIEQVFSEIEERYSRTETYLASIELDDGTWLNFTIAVAPAAAWSFDTIALAGLIVALVLGASLWALRRLTAPYKVLAGAAERFSRDINSPPMSEGGPREVRAASHAFNLMQERLRRVIEDRDQLAAAISHDLRTPVTRLRLRAEFVDNPEQRGRMLEDLDEIEVMTQSVLTFARDSARPAPRETVDLVSLVETLCDDLPEVKLSLQGLPPRLPYNVEPVSLRRAVANLVDNAVRYGGCAHVSMAVDAGAARIVVEDDGPGIPEEEMEAVFRPFRRLETSRNRETGGTGLGLTIARTFARAHGGDVVLSRRAAGGLRAEIVLPLPAAPVSPASADT